LKYLSGSGTRFSQTSEIQLEGRITSLSISPNGSELLAGTSAGNIYRVQISAFDFTIHTEGHTSAVNDVAFPAMKNETFATIDNEGAILVWDGEEIIVKNKCNLWGKSLVGKTVTFTDDGLVVGGWEDGFLRAFEGGKAKNAVLKWEIANAHRGNVTTLFIVRT
jgi:WD40 repeat protein